MYEPVNPKHKLKQQLISLQKPKGALTMAKIERKSQNSVSMREAAAKEVEEIRNSPVLESEEDIEDGDFTDVVDELELDDEDMELDDEDEGPDDEALDDDSDAEEEGEEDEGEEDEGEDLGDDVAEEKGVPLSEDAEEENKTAGPELGSFLTRLFESSSSEYVSVSFAPRVFILMQPEGYASSEGVDIPSVAQNEDGMYVSLASPLRSGGKQKTRGTTKKTAVGFAYPVLGALADYIASMGDSSFVMSYTGDSESVVSSAVAMLHDGLRSVVEENTPSQITFRSHNNAKSSGGAVEVDASAEPDLMTLDVSDLYTLTLSVQPRFEGTNLEIGVNVYFSLNMPVLSIEEGHESKIVALLKVVEYCNKVAGSPAFNMAIIGDSNRSLDVSFVNLLNDCLNTDSFMVDLIGSEYLSRAVDEDDCPYNITPVTDNYSEVAHTLFPIGGDYLILVLPAEEEED